MAEPKKYPLTAEELREWLHYDPGTGVFTWIETSGDRAPAGKVAGCLCKKHGYILIRLNKRLYRAHRLAWLYVHGEWPETDLDHRDTVRHHNWIENLRPASDSQNACNRAPTSGLKGASWNSDREAWAAQISVGNEHHWLGLHPTEEAAHEAYKAAAIRLHGEFARFE